MKQENEIYRKLQSWAKENESIRAIILTSSRANPNSLTDILSDYDIELYVKDIKPFMNDKWLHFLGRILIRWPLKPASTFDKNWITRLVLFEDGTRIDFQITSKRSVNPSNYDSGYKVLVDKDDLTKDIEEPTYSEFFIKKPTKEEYEVFVNDFFWNATYVAKNLWRDELYYAKFMLDNAIRFEYLQKVIEWYIAIQQNWRVNTNKHGRWFKRYLNPNIWAELENTFSGADIEENWEAFFGTIDLFRKLAKSVAERLEYKYPDNLDSKMSEYYLKIKTLEK